MEPFESFAGNRAVCGALARMLRTDRLVHAIIFEGPAGLGKRTLARAVARASVCTAPRDGMPCGECVACRSAAAGSNPDVTEIAPKKSAIVVEQIRALRTDAYILPNQSARRVFLLPDAETMTEYAQNALLKVLEEPPAHVLFLLTCEFSHQLLDTVVSRAAVFALSPVAPQEGAPVLRARHPELSAQEAEEAVRAAGGNLGRALAQLEGGSPASGCADAILGALLEPNEYALLKACAALERDRALQRETVALVRRRFEDALACKSGALDRGEACRALAARLTAGQLAALAQAAAEAASDVESNLGGPLFVTNLCACLRAAVGL